MQVTLETLNLGASEGHSYEILMTVVVFILINIDLVIVKTFGVNLEDKATMVVWDGPYSYLNICT